MNAATHQASASPLSGSGNGPRTSVLRRTAAGAQSAAAAAAGSAHAASEAVHEPPNARASGTAAPLPSDAPSPSAIEYAPVSSPVAPGNASPMSTGKAAWP